jgi:lysozyme
MRHITKEGLEIIKHFEGFSAEPYHCAGGYETIGYGHVIQPGEEELLRGVSRLQAEALLREDVLVAEKSVLRYIAVPLKDGQFDALVRFTFNLGAGALQRSTLRRKVNREEHADVPAEFHRWVWAGGRKWPGLIRRRAAEAQHYALA